MENKNEITLMGQTIQSLTTMVVESVNYQTTVSPIFEQLGKRILDILNKEDELNAMETKDLLKLLDIANKAQIQPVVELTKLVQSVNALYEKSQLQDKINKLEQVVNTLKLGQEDHIKEIETEEVDDSMHVDIDSIISD